METDFDIIQYFEDNDIEYWTKGKNIAKGNIAITCPFCGDHHYSGNNHCGVHLKSKMFYCWLCSAKGYVNNLIAEIEECSLAQANTIIAKYSGESIFPEKAYTPTANKNTRRHFGEILPKGASNQFSKLHLDYLKGRNFDPDVIIPKYKLKCCHNIGAYKFRIVIPIIQDRRIVHFTSRDVTGKTDIRYKTCPDEIAILPMTHCLYNIDNVRSDTILIVEGATDVWRFGNGTVAILRTGFSNAQINLILGKRIKRAFIMFDSEPQAIGRANQLARRLGMCIDHTEVIELKEGDPCSLPEADVAYLKKEIGL